MIYLFLLLLFFNVREKLLVLKNSNEGAIPPEADLVTKRVSRDTFLFYITLLIPKAALSLLTVPERDT